MVILLSVTNIIHYGKLVRAIIAYLRKKKTVIWEGVDGGVICTRLSVYNAI